MDDISFGLVGGLFKSFHVGIKFEKSMEKTPWTIYYFFVKLIIVELHQAYG